MVAMNALDLAKERGAKFDPEPVELPKLRMCGGPKACLVGASRTDTALSSEEALEVIRRCELVDKIKEFTANHYRFVESNKAGFVEKSTKYVPVNMLLDIVEGKI